MVSDEVVNRRVYIRTLVVSNPGILLDDLIRWTGASRSVVLSDLTVLRERRLIDRNLRRKKVAILD